MSVDLPAPLSPTRATTSPAWISKSTSTSASTEPNRLDTPWAANRNHSPWPPFSSAPSEAPATRGSMVVLVVLVAISPSASPWVRPAHSVSDPAEGATSGQDPTPERETRRPCPRTAQRDHRSRLRNGRGYRVVDNRQHGDHESGTRHPAPGTERAAPTIHVEPTPRGRWVVRREGRARAAS